MSKSLVFRLREALYSATAAEAHEAADTIERLQAEYSNACELVAKMHAAAVGEITGPKRGVVEDVEDLRKQRDELHESLGRIVHYYDLAKSGSSLPSLTMQARAEHENTMFGAARKALASVKESK